MSDINVTNNAQDSFCEAVDYIVNDAIRRTPRDLTLDGIITDVSNKANYRYRVKTNESEFDAYALQGTSYYKNDSVLIHVPMGDFKNQKTILSRKSDGDAVNEIFAFKLPFDDFIAFRNLNEENAAHETEYGFWANYNSEKYAVNNSELIATDTDNQIQLSVAQKNIQDSFAEKLLWRWNYETSNFSTTIGNTRLGIQADLQTFLGDYAPIAGVYGFRIVVEGRAVNKEEVITREYFFTNKDMYGNTYAFYTPYSQQKVLDISDFCNIHDIKIYFYQDYNFLSATSNSIIKSIWYDDFIETDGVYYPADPENIIIQNIEIFLGISTADITDEKTYLYSYDPLQYTSAEIKKDNNDNIYRQNENGVYVDSNGNILDDTIEVSSFYECTSKHDLIFTWVHYAKEDGMTFHVVKNIDDLIQQREKSQKDAHVFWYRYNYDDELQNSDLKYFPAQNEDFTFNKDDEKYHKNYQEMYDNLKDAQDSNSYTSKIQLYGGEGWTFIPGLTDAFNWDNIEPRADKSRERIKVVVQHHGTHTTSEILTLENTRDVESELAHLARNDMFLIKCFRVREVDGKPLAIEDSSLNAFHIYDENNHILHNELGDRYDYEKFYLQIHVKDEDTGLYSLLNTVDEKNGTNLNRIISWLIPENYTMIENQYPVSKTDAEYFSHLLTFKDTNGQVTSSAEYINIDSPEYKNFYNATVRFQVKSILNNAYQNNIVNAIITYNNEKYYLQKDLMFGRAEGEGHEFLPIIELIQPYNASGIISGQPFQIGCVVYNKDGSILQPSNTNILHFTWKELSNKVYFQDNNAKARGLFKDVIETINDGETSYTKNLLIGNYLSFNAEEDRKESFIKKYNKYNNNVVSGIIVPNDGTYYSPIFEVTVSGAADYDITVRKAFPVYTFPNNSIDLEQRYSFTVPTRIEFKSDGVDPVYYNSVFSVKKDGEEQYDDWFQEEDKPEALAWTLTALDENGIELKEPLFEIKALTQRCQELENDEGNNYSSVIRHYYDYKMIPSIISNDSGVSDSEKDRLSWSPDLLKHYYYLTWEKDNEIRFTQALAFDRNLYSSSLVNEWDGTSLTWDEENGSILSTMIAAGSKDNNNKFTGVMMGDWKTKGDESLDTPGMYGYNQGAQTFGFKTDGTGFIGASGKGRIEFDGNNALISNSNKTCYINLNPIVNRGTDRGYSQNFIYCQVPKSQDESNYNTSQSGIENETSWANPYARDTENDYFIVDPNHGILTTGGLIARYGKIGNWMISTEGLYQKTPNSYMYLGIDQSDVNITSTFKTVKQDLNILRAGFVDLFNKIIKQDNNQLQNSYYYDVVQKLKTIFSQSTLTDDFKSVIEENKNKINNNENLIDQYDTDIDQIKGDEDNNNIQEKLSFKYLYNTYISDESLNYHNLLEKLESLLLSYNSQLNFDDLILYLTDQENDTDYTNYKDFIENLVEHKEKKYTTSLLGYDKYDDDHNRITIDDKNIISTIKPSIVYLNNYDSISGSYASIIENLNEELAEINIDIQEIQEQLNDDTNNFIQNDNGLFSADDKENFNVINNNFQLLETIQDNFSEQKTAYETLQAEISELISNKVLVIQCYNELADMNKELGNLTNSDLQASKKKEIEAKTTQIKNLLLILDQIESMDDNLPAQTTVNSSLNTLIRGKIIGVSNNDTTEFNEYQNIFSKIVYNRTSNNTVDSIEELYQSIIEHYNNGNDEIINNLIKQYQSFLNGNTSSFTFKGMSNSTQYDAMNANDMKHNADMLAICTQNLNIINQILTRQRLVILNKYEAVGEVPEYITENQNAFNILQINGGAIRNTINVLLQDLSYINKIYNFYNNLILAIQSKINKLTSNNVSYQTIIDNHISELINIYDIIINLLTNETYGIIPNTKKINNYLIILEEQKQLLLDTGIYTEQDLSDWIEIIYNDFYNIVSIETINEYNTIRTSLNELLNNFKNAILANNTQEITKLKNQIITLYNQFCNLLKVDLNKSIVVSNVANSYNTLLDNILYNIDSILLDKIEDYLDLLTATTTYAIYVADKDPNDIANVEINPYFSVARDGTMFARKGIIANTWTINDYSLTYEKNSDKIYLGQGLSKYNPGIANGYLLSDGAGWSFSAGVVDKDQNYNVNFGVTTDGQMYSNSGQIGKWYISNNTLQGKPKDSDASNGNFLIFDANENTIKAANNAFIIDGSKGEIYLGRYLLRDDDTSVDTVIGNMYLASFLMSGRTLASTDNVINNINFDYVQSVIENQNVSSTTMGGVTENYGWGMVHLSEGVLTEETAVSHDYISYSLDLNNTSYLQFLDEIHDHHGAVLAVGSNGSDTTGAAETVTVFYPVSDVNNVLGADGHRWDLLAKYIDTKNLTAQGINCKGRIYMLEGELVASQPWVRDQLYDLWNAIGDLSSGAGGASRNGNAQSITGAQWIGEQGSNGGYKIGMRFTRGNGSTFDSNTSGELAGAYHGHRIELKRVGTSIQATATTYSGTGATAYGPALPIDHTHPLTGSFSDGTFTVKLGGADFSKTMSSPYTYDVRTSAWYKGRIAAYWSGVSAKAERVGSDENATVKVTITDGSGVDGINFADKSGTGFSLSSYWTIAYNKGWNACIDDIDSWYEDRTVSCAGYCICGEPVNCTGSTSVKVYDIPSKK